MLFEESVHFCSWHFCFCLVPRFSALVAISSAIEGIFSWPHLWETTSSDYIWFFIFMLVCQFLFHPFYVLFFYNLANAFRVFRSISCWKSTIKKIKNPLLSSTVLGPSNLKGLSQQSVIFFYFQREQKNLVNVIYCIQLQLDCLYE